jgi:hypothetical protein
MVGLGMPVRVAISLFLETARRRRHELAVPGDVLAVE